MRLTTFGSLWLRTYLDMRLTEVASLISFVDILKWMLNQGKESKFRLLSLVVRVSQLCLQCYTIQ